MGNTIKILLLFVIIIGFAAFNIIRTNKREAYLRKLDAVLAEEGYDAYSRMLDSKEAGKFIRVRNANRLRLNAAIVKKNNEEAERLIGVLNNTPMSLREFVNYNMTVLGYAVVCKNKDMAETARAALHKPGVRKAIAREADQVYDIYLCHNTGYIDELEEFSRKCKSPSGKAMAYFRIAKSYYYLGDMEQCEKYVKRSKNVFADPAWGAAMQEIIDNNYKTLE